MKVDYKRMLEEGSSAKVCEDFGIEIHERYGKEYILCPSHKKVLGKADKHPRNCIINGNKYYCFACHTGGTFVRLIADYLDMPFETIEDKIKVEELVAKTSYPEYLYEGDDGERTVTSTLLPLPFQREDLLLLGLQDTVIKEPVRLIEAGKPVDEVGLRKSYDTIHNDVLVRETPYSMRQAFNDDPDGFKEMVHDKAVHARAVAGKFIENGYAENQEIEQYAYDVLRATERILNIFGESPKEIVHRKIEYDLTGVSF